MFTVELEGKDMNKLLALINNHINKLKSIKTPYSLNSVVEFEKLYEYLNKIEEEV